MATVPPLTLANIQGDILVGLPKKTQAFFFFQIDEQEIPAFRSRLSELIPHITTAENAQKDRSNIKQFKLEKKLRGNAGDGETVHPLGLLPVAGVNVAFSQFGIQKLGVTGSIGDNLFTSGMKIDAKNLGDKNIDQNGGFEPDWDAEFKTDIDGVVLVTGDCRDTVDQSLREVKRIFDCSVKEVTTIFGDVRPGEEAGHEHFGYQDGISQPAVQDVDTPLPGQTPVQQGVALLGRAGDAQQSARPPWAIDGSFLAFRKLPQLVPEFNNFLLNTAKPVDDPTVNVVDLLGARFVGRWKSGAPVVLAPLKDDPDLAVDKNRNNNFQFTPQSQDVCPFAAHIRKTNPRADIPESAIQPSLILRRGIPFGPEVTPEEEAAKVTLHERGLLFVCYQSNLDKGFSFLQHSWANAVDFPPREPQLPGPDPLIGQTSDNLNGTRTITGAFSGDPAQPTELTQQWILSKGGEYFFSPSIDALKNTFAASATTL